MPQAPRFHTERPWCRHGHYLSGPQVELLERRQFDEVLRAGTGDVGEGQTEVLQVAEGAGAQQTRQVSVL